MSDRKKAQLERAIRAMQRVQMGWRGMGDEVGIDEARLHEVMADLSRENDIEWNQASAQQAFYLGGTDAKQMRGQLIDWHKDYDDYDPTTDDVARIMFRWCDSVHDQLVRAERDLLRCLKLARKRQYVRASTALRAAAEEAGDTARLITDIKELIQGAA